MVASVQFGMKYNFLVKGKPDASREIAQAVIAQLPKGSVINHGEERRTRQYVVETKTEAASLGLRQELELLETILGQLPIAKKYNLKPILQKLLRVRQEEKRESILLRFNPAKKK